MQCTHAHGNTLAGHHQRKRRSCHVYDYSLFSSLMKYECAQRDPSKLIDRQTRHANILPLKLEITIWQVFHLTTVKMGMVDGRICSAQLSAK